MFITEAMAATASAPGPQEVLSQFAPLILIFVVFFLFIIRPQMKRAKEQRGMIEALAKGDEVITSGGIIGRVTEVDETNIKVEIAANVIVTVQKQAVLSAAKTGAANKSA